MVIYLLFSVFFHLKISSKPLLNTHKKIYSPTCFLFFCFLFSFPNQFFVSARLFPASFFIATFIVEFTIIGVTMKNVLFCFFLSQPFVVTIMQFSYIFNEWGQGHFFRVLVAIVHSLLVAIITITEKIFEYISAVPFNFVSMLLARTHFLLTKAHTVMQTSNINL